MSIDSCRVGKGVVHMHGVANGKAQHRAHHGRIGVEQAMMVGTARCAVPVAMPCNWPAPLPTLQRRG